MTSGNCPVLIKGSVVRCPVLTDNFETPRFPVTQEHLALYIASGRAPRFEAEEWFDEAFYEGVVALVRSLARKFDSSCRDSPDDLTQECWHRIIRKLHTFDPNKGKFTTWCWRVCYSVLNTRYFRSQRYRSRFVELPEWVDDDYIGGEDARSDASSNDIYDAVDELMAKHPDQKSIIKGLFGTKRGLLPCNINIKEVARECELPCSEVRKFLVQVVRPFFKQRFEEIKK